MFIISFPSLSLSQACLNFYWIVMSSHTKTPTPKKIEIKLERAKIGAHKIRRTQGSEKWGYLSMLTILRLFRRCYCIYEGILPKPR